MLVRKVQCTWTCCVDMLVSGCRCPGEGGCKTPLAGYVCCAVLCVWGAYLYRWCRCDSPGRVVLSAAVAAAACNPLNYAWDRHLSAVSRSRQTTSLLTSALLHPTDNTSLYTSTHTRAPTSTKLLLHPQTLNKSDANAGSSAAYSYGQHITCTPTNVHLQHSFCCCEKYFQHLPEELTWFRKNVKR